MDLYPSFSSFSNAVITRTPERQATTRLDESLDGLGNPYRNANSSSSLLKASSNSDTEIYFEKQTSY